MRGWRLLTLVPQAALVILVLFIRTTTSWQVATVGVASMAAVCTHIRRRSHYLADGRKVGPQAVRSLTPILLLLAGYSSLQIYRHAVFPAAYHRGDQIETRVVWHNIFSGLAIDPVLAQRWQLRIDDRSEVLAVRQYLLEAGRQQEWAAMNVAHAVFDDDRFNGDLLRWSLYEPIVRELLFKECRSQVWECLKAAAYYKPRSLLHDLGWIYGLTPLPADLEIFTGLKDDVIATTQQLDAGHMRAYLWSPLGLLSVLAATFLVWKDTEQAMAAWAGLVVLTAGSSLPIVLGYPATHTISEMAITVSAFLYLSAALGLGRLARRLARTRSINLNTRLLPIFKRRAS